MVLAAVCSKAVVLLMLIRCWLFLPLWDSVIVVFFVHYFVYILVLQSSRWGRESWLLCFVFLVSRDYDATSLSAVCDCAYLILQYFQKE